MLEDGEVFDSNLLKETVYQLIASGRRNFALDLAPLDYIYSDTINIMLALNKRILDVSGRLSLLGPQPEVFQILKRAGIHNILRVFDTEADLLRTSEDIILQTSSFKLADIKQIAEELEPESEFDALRSEISEVLGAAPTQRAAAPVPPAQPKAPVEAVKRGMDDQGSLEQEFDMTYQALSDQPEIPPIAQQPRPQAPQQFTPLPPKGFSGPQQQFQPRPFSPQAPQGPAQSQPRKYTPPAPPPAGVTPEFSARTETRRFGTAPGAPVTPPPPPPAKRPEPTPAHQDFDDEFSKFESNTEKPRRPSQQKIEPESDTFDDDMDVEDEVKKKSVLPVIILLAILVVVGGAGVLIGYMKFFKTPQVAVTTPTANTETKQSLPQLPVEQAQAPVEPTVAEPVKAAPVAQKAVAPVKKEPKMTASEKARLAKQAAAQAAREAKAETARQAREAKAAASVSAPKGSNQIVITSNPSGAIVSVNGREMGATPYTWGDPFLGGVTLTVSKPGFKDNSKSVEFTGGSMKQFFALEKEEVKASAPAPSYPAPRNEPAPAPSDFGSSEPAPAPAPVSVPAPSAASSGAAGSDASIFIASIPPVADVYLDGKLIGKTNISELKVVSGTHQIKFSKGGSELTKEMTFQPGKNPSQMVRIP